MVVEKRPRPRSRREALAIIGAFGVVALAGCSSDNDSGSGAPSTTRAPVGGATGTNGSTTSCVLTPELTQGPFFLADHPNASNLVQDREGTPLTLGFTVVGPSCAPVDSARVDIWHCDAAGEYAGVSAAGGGPPGGPDGAATRANDQTWCQGYQDAGADGRVQFTTIYPGWYPGRAVHVHVKVFAGGDAVHTGQLFFPDGLSEALFTNPPYRGAPDTTNEADSIYASGGSATLLVPTRRDDGYVADVQLVVDA
jgi:protocatechuate 3,4-dioxygenase beta subunit